MFETLEHLPYISVMMIESDIEKRINWASTWAFGSYRTSMLKSLLLQQRKQQLCKSIVHEIKFGDIAVM